jgi:hypothetical protein
MRALLPLLIGIALWSFAGWSAHPRELWDVPAFQPVWIAATLAAAVFGLTRASRPLRDTAFLFLPIIGVLTVTTVMTGGSASMLPLGIILIAALALPGLALAWVANRLAARWR